MAFLHKAAVYFLNAGIPSGAQAGCDGARDATVPDPMMALVGSLEKQNCWSRPSAVGRVLRDGKVLAANVESGTFSRSRTPQGRSTGVARYRLRSGVRQRLQRPVSA
jgi:hypothetical protein